MRPMWEIPKHQPNKQDPIGDSADFTNKNMGFKRFVLVKTYK